MKCTTLLYRAISSLILCAFSLGICKAQSDSSIIRIVSDSVFRAQTAPCVMDSNHLNFLKKDSSGFVTSGLIVPGSFDPGAIETCAGGKIKIYYEDLLSTNPAAGFSEGSGLGATRRATFCAVLSYIASTIDLSNISTSDPLRIYVQKSYASSPSSSNAPSSALSLGTGGAFFPSTGSGIFNGFMHDYIVNGTDPAPSNGYHAILQINFDKIYVASPLGLRVYAISYQDDYSAAPSNCKYDLYSELLHVMGHCLGWESFVKMVPNSLFSYFPTPYNPSQPNYFSSIDTSISSNMISTLNAYPFLFTHVVLYNSSTGLFYVNTSPSAYMTGGNYWLNDKDAPENHSIFDYGLSGEDLDFSINYLTDGNNLLRHLNDWYGNYTRNERVSPGDIQEYVMGPIAIQGVYRRNFVKGEIQTFNRTLGYNIIGTGSTTVLNNHLPHSPRMALYKGCFLNLAFPVLFPDTVSADYTITNNTGISPVTIDLNDPTHTGFFDADGDPMVVYPGSLVNFRGCGNVTNGAGTGTGNNHEQLTLSNYISVSGGYSIIKYTPRADFFGRAQFGFNLYDGKEKGAFVWITIDVKKGTSISYTAGDEMVLNGDFEEGSEVKRMGTEEGIPNSDVDEADMHEGRLFGCQFGDSHPFDVQVFFTDFFNAGEVIENSYIPCGSASISTYTTAHGYTSFPSTNGTWGNNPPAATASGSVKAGKQRYQIYPGAGSNGSFFLLKDTLRQCHRYKLEFDIMNEAYASFSLIPMLIGFPDNLNNPTAPSFNYSFTNTSNILTGNWTHVSIPFWYCGTSPSGLLFIKSNFYYGNFCLDNISLKEDLSSPSTLSVSVSGGIISNCKKTLTAAVSNAACNLSYQWYLGGTAISGATNSTYQIPDMSNSVYMGNYTVTVSDACRTATSSNLNVSLAPLPTAVILTPNVTVCSGNVVSLTAQSGTGYSYHWYEFGGPIGTSSSLLNPYVFTASATVTTTYPYSVLVTGANGCSAMSGTVNVTVEAPSDHCAMCNIFGTEAATLPATISSNVSAGNYHMSSNVTISGQVKITGANIVIDNNVGITLANNATLVLDNCHLFTCQDKGNFDMWNGITVTNPHTGLYIADNTLIEDAHTAVFINSSSLPSTFPSGFSGLKFKIENSILNKNSTGIDIEGYTGTNYPFSITNSAFTSNDYAGVSGYPAAWPSVSMLEASTSNPAVTAYQSHYAVRDYSQIGCKNGTSAVQGIKLGNEGTTVSSGGSNTYYGITIGDASGASKNLFNNMYYGIGAAYSNFSSYYNVFADMHSNNTGNGTGDGIYGLSGTVIGSYPNPTVAYMNKMYVDNNEFYDCISGAEANGMYNVSIQNSEVVSNHLCSQFNNSNTITQGSFGLKVTTAAYDNIDLSGNTIANCKYGIQFYQYTRFSSVHMGPINISKNQIEVVPNGINGNSGLTYSGSVTSSTDYPYCYMGIDLENAVNGNLQAASPYVIQIDNNTIQDSYNGIIANTFPKQTVQSTYNGIKLQQALYYNIPSSVKTTQYGVAYSNCNSGNVINNDISAVWTKAGVHDICTGVFVATSPKATVCSNKMHNIGTDFQFSGNNPLSTWIRNTMSESGRGLYVYQGYIGAQQGTSSGLFSVKKAAMNYWDVGTSWSSTNPQTYLFNSLSDNSTLYIKSMYMPSNPPAGYYPTVNGSNSLPFANWYNSTHGLLMSNTDPDACGTKVGMRMADMEAIAQNGVSYAVKHRVSAWMDQYALIQTISNDSSVIDSSTVLPPFDSLVASSRFAYLNQIEQYLADGDPGSAETALGSVPGAWSATDAATGATIADGATLDYVVDNYTKFYHIYADYIDSTFNGYDTTDLLYLVNLCPLENGAVVYQARSLYTLVYNDPEVWPDTSCDVDSNDYKIGSSQPGSGRISQQQYSLHPNPSDGNIYINQYLKDEELVSVEVMNGEGKAVYKGSIVFKNSMVNLNLKGLTPGVYLLHLRDSSGRYYALKFIVN